MPAAAAAVAKGEGCDDHITRRNRVGCQSVAVGRRAQRRRLWGRGMQTTHIICRQKQARGTQKEMTIICSSDDAKKLVHCPRLKRKRRGSYTTTAAAGGAASGALLFTRRRRSVHDEIIRHLTDVLRLPSSCTRRGGLLLLQQRGIGCGGAGSSGRCSGLGSCPRPALRCRAPGRDDGRR